MTKLTGNVLWASSRFMLPQHVESSVKQARDAKKKTKQALDDDVLTEIDRKLQESQQQDKIVTLIVFDEFEDQEHMGVVRKLDSHLRRVKLETSDGFIWIPFNDIVSVY